MPKIDNKPPEAKKEEQILPHSLQSESTLSTPQFCISNQQNLEAMKLLFEHMISDIFLCSPRK
jgi:hypothetical protein